MQSYLRQATNSQSRAIGPFVDEADFKTAETGLTIANTDIKLVVNGGASANKNSGGGTHRVNGVYGITFDATDTATVGEMLVSIVVAGALPVFATFVVLEEAVYDALFAASAPGYLQPTTAGRTLDVSAGGEAGVDWANIGSPTTSVNLSGTTVKTATDVETDTADIQSRLPAALVSGRMDASVGAMAANVLTASAIASDAITAAKIATDAIDADALAAGAVAEIQSGLSTLDAAGVRSAVGLASANLDTQLGTIDTVVDAIKVTTDKLDDTLEDDGGTFRFTENALEEAPAGGGGGPTAADIADAVWDEAIADHQDAGSTGEALTDAGAGGNPWNAVLEGSLTAGDLQRITAAAAVGKTVIVKIGEDHHEITFRDVSDASDLVVGELVDGERTSVTVSP